MRGGVGRDWVADRMMHGPRSRDEEGERDTKGAGGTGEDGGGGEGRY